MNKEINMKKDPAVELARIFGCLLVVGVHCWINSFGVAIQEQKRNIYSLYFCRWCCSILDYIRIFYVQELQL